MKNKIREFRVEKLWTQETLSHESGVNQSTLSQLENQLIEPMPLTKAKISKALGASIEEVFPDE